MCETAPPFWCQRGKPRQGGGGLANWKQTWGEVMYGCVRLLQVFPPNYHWCPRLIRPLGNTRAFTSRTEERQQRCWYWTPSTGGHCEIRWVTLRLLKKESGHFLNVKVRQNSERPNYSPAIWWADSGCRLIFSWWRQLLCTPVNVSSCTPFSFRCSIAAGRQRDLKMWQVGISAVEDVYWNIYTYRSIFNHCANVLHSKDSRKCTHIFSLLQWQQ